MADTQLKSNLLHLAKTGYEQQRAFIDGLTPSERIQAGTSIRWSAKDTIGHLTYWQAYRVAQYQRLLQGEMPERLTEIDEYNARLIEEYRDRPWPQVIAAAEESFAALLAHLESTDETTLTTPNSLPPPMNGQLWRLFWIYGFSHILNHCADYYFNQGESERALLLQEKRVRDTATLGIDDVRGAAEYDLACLYAKVGHKERALTMLRSALHLAPRLREWSRADQDLISLHNDPEYEVLY